MLDAGTMTPRMCLSGTTECMCMCACMWAYVGLGPGEVGSEPFTTIGEKNLLSQGAVRTQRRAVLGLEHGWGRNGFLEEVSAGAKDSWQHGVG